MQIYIDWTYNPKIDKWVMRVFRNQGCIALLLRPDEESCKQWAEQNMRLCMQGKQPHYI